MEKEKSRDHYTFFFSYYDSISDLDRDEQVTMRNAIDEFMFYDIEPDFEDRKHLRSVWKALLPNLTMSKLRSKANRERKNKNNQHTKQRTQQTATNAQQTATNAANPIHEEEKEEESEIEYEIGEGGEINSPSLDDVLGYWRSKFANCVPENCAKKFYAYCNEHSKWSRDWKASFDTWAAREPDFGNKKRGKQTRQEVDPYAHMLKEQEERERKEREEADIPKGLAALNEIRKQRELEHMK